MPVMANTEGVHYFCCTLWLTSHKVV